MKIVIITGAASSLGVHIVNDFATKGYTVIAMDKYYKDFENDNVIFIKVDLRDKTQIELAFKQIELRYEKAHILINNSCVNPKYDTLHEFNIDDFDDVLAVNLRGAFLCSNEFSKLNTNEDYGRIINIASTRFDKNEANYEAYGASKGAIVSLTNSLCITFSDTPITVNAITPGWIETDDYDSLTEEDHLSHPSRRVGKPSDITRACLFLCENENDFINGANIVIDGGMTK